MITAGIEVGTKNTKVVLMNDDKILGYSFILTGLNPGESVDKALYQALQAAGVSENQVKEIGFTGLCKDYVDIADIKVNDLEAMGQAAVYYFPSARTAVDVGAEEARAARIDQSGRVVDFAASEKCAAGAGYFIEAMAEALKVDLEDMGSMALQSDKKIPMNAQCVVFAESEIEGLMRNQTAKKDISKAIHDAMASRIASLILRIGVNKDVVLLGGVGRNSGFVETLRKELKLDKIYVPDEPEYGPAVGAALASSQQT